MDSPNNMDSSIKAQIWLKPQLKKELKHHYGNKTNDSMLNSKNKIINSSYIKAQ